MVALLPEHTLHNLKKRYYAYLFTHSPQAWQEEDSLVVKHLVMPGERVVDIGASIGEYTKLLSGLVGPSGKVYSFEPNPPIYEYLSHNIKKLALSNVELFDVALSDTRRSDVIAIPQYRWGSECHYDATLEAKKMKPEYRQVAVTVTTLDSVLDDREPISFIKCDVNYHELPCLYGAVRTLQRSKPAILIEILRNPDDPASTAARVFELLREHAYEGYWFDGKVLRKRQRGERSQNYFFLTQSHVEKLESLLLV
jgi:FkbM family methyltransferase